MLHCSRERTYQCYVCQRAQGEDRDLSRKLRDLSNHELISALLNFLDSGIRKLYVPKAIKSMNILCNVGLSSLYISQYKYM
jgi:hypothetical protein